MKSPVRLVIADDHAMVREGLAEILASREGMEVVGETPNEASRVATLVREKKPDVVIMEVEMPIEKAKGSISEILRITPTPKVLILTTLEAPHVARELLELGASAYVFKRSSAEQLIGTIRATTLTSGQGNAIVTMPRGVLERAEGVEGVLSRRQVEILLLVARGFSNRQIGDQLWISENTVKRHLYNVYHSMKVRSRMEAVKKAVAGGWITPDEVALPLSDSEGDSEGDTSDKPGSLANS